MSELNIYQRINAVMQKVSYAQKDKTVTGGGLNYKAVTHDQVVHVARAALVEHGIMIAPNQVKGDILIERDINAVPNPVKMALYSGWYEINFINIDNGEDRVTVTIEAHANDNGDKAPGKALTYATKAAILKVLCLETGENDESRGETENGYTDHQKDQFDELLESGEALGFVVFSQAVGPEILTSLNGSFKKGEISKGKQLVKDLSSEGWKIIQTYADQISELIAAEDPAVGEIIDELTVDEKRLVANKLTATQIQYLKEIK